MVELSLTNTGWFALLLVPLALAVTVAIYAVALPLSLTLYATEELLVNPMKWGFNAILPDENEAFIEEIVRAAP